MTKVIFRKDKETKNIIAFFPQFTANYGNIVCYQHVGQHGEASYDFYKDTLKATQNEYNDLLVELEQQGYDDLRVTTRLYYEELIENWR